MKVKAVIGRVAICFVHLGADQCSLLQSLLHDLLDLLVEVVREQPSEDVLGLVRDQRHRRHDELCMEDGPAEAPRQGDP